MQSTLERYVREGGTPAVKNEMRWSVSLFFQAEDGIRDCSRDWSSDVCSSDLIELKRVRRIALRVDPLLPKQVRSYLSYPPTRNNRGILKHVQSLPPRYQHRLSVHSVQQWLESHKLLPSSVSQRSLHI